MTVQFAPMLYKVKGESKTPRFWFWQRTSCPQPTTAAPIASCLRKIAFFLIIFFNHFEKWKGIGQRVLCLLFKIWNLPFCWWSMPGMEAWQWNFWKSQNFKFDWIRLDMPNQAWRNKAKMEKTFDYFVENSTPLDSGTSQRRLNLSYLNCQNVRQTK